MLRLTSSPLDLGLASAFQFLPTLVLGLLGGVVADRFDKRRTLILTQTAFGAFAAALGALTATGLVRLWEVYALALGSGLVTAVDAPTRQAFVAEMVGEGDLPNAVALNSSVFNSARAVGPAVAGALIASVGLAACFYLNAASYLAVIASLLRMRPELLHHTRARRESVLAAVRSALAYVHGSRVITLILGLIAVIGTFGMNLQVLVPVLARLELRVGAAGFGVLSSASGAGALLGALAVASVRRVGVALVLAGAFAYGAVELALALPVGYGGAIALLFAAGAGSIVYTAASNSLLQLNVSGELRGRVMSMYFLLFAGTTPIGAPVVGAIAGRFGTAGGFQFCGAVTLLAALCGALAMVPARAAGPRLH